MKIASSLIVKSALGLMGAVFFAVFLISHINNAVISTKERKKIHINLVRKGGENR